MRTWYYYRYSSQQRGSCMQHVLTTILHLSSAPWRCNTTKMTHQNKHKQQKQSKTYIHINYIYAQMQSPTLARGPTYLFLCWHQCQSEGASTSRSKPLFTSPSSRWPDHSAAQWCWCRSFAPRTQQDTRPSLPARWSGKDLHHRVYVWNDDDIAEMRWDDMSCIIRCCIQVLCLLLITRSSAFLNA